MAPITIITVDDHEIYRKGLNELLCSEEGFLVVGSAATAAELMELLEQGPLPRVLLLDLFLPSTNPETLLCELRARYPELPILYQTLARGTRYLHRLLQHGVQGYVLKNAAWPQMVAAIRAVAAGGTWYSAEIDITTPEDDAYRSTLTLANHQVHEILTPREIEILAMVCKEYSSSDIAAQLFVSVSTVDTHRRNIMQKLGVNNVVGLVKYALQQGLLKDA